MFRSLTLRWHYRSRHEDLIAFSNHSFYKNRLITFPGAHESGPDIGVEFFPVDGVYRRNGAKDNPVEAEAVAQRVVHHFTTRPTMSLGVVAFSESQAACIENAVERARAANPHLDRFFNDDRLDGFFVKNLESVQGDERDVMLFSIGYGPDENGRILMNFGPLIKAGGQRRLNVAVTRARYRNEVISSMSASDITATAHSEGTRALRRYLDFAARGSQALFMDGATGGDVESPFEESVITAIRHWGYEVQPQVGVAGYRIDMAVRHPTAVKSSSSGWNATDSSTTPPRWPGPGPVARERPQRPRLASAPDLGNRLEPQPQRRGEAPGRSHRPRRAVADPWLVTHHATQAPVLPTVSPSRPGRADHRTGPCPTGSPT